MCCERFCATDCHATGTRCVFTSLLMLAMAAWPAIGSAQAQAIVREVTHSSQVFSATRAYQAVLPPAYTASQKRYPVIYWFHGYEHPSDEIANQIAAFVAAHDVIVVRVGPADTVGQFPLYFPELADHVDKTFRTLADRKHRAVTGYSMGGFVAFWMAAKYPDLIASASSFMATPEATAGPAGFDVEYNLADLYGNYDGVRTRLVTWTRDSTQFYHRQLNALWSLGRTNHETEDFDSPQNASAIARTLEFHMHAFALPLPKPAIFNHADAYPNFAVWGWQVISNRRRPAFTVLENVSRAGFRSAVREWVPGGALIPEVKLSISTPAMFPPGSSHQAVYIRLRDGNVRRIALKADAQGRLNFDLDGDAYEVGVGAEPHLAITGYEIAGAAWATAGKPVKLNVKFWNKGGARSATGMVQWQSPNPGVKFETPTARLFGLAPGESALLPLTLTVESPAQALVKIIATPVASPVPATGARTGAPGAGSTTAARTAAAARTAIPGAGSATQLSLEVPLFPAADPVSDFEIADGRQLNIWQHAVRRADVLLGQGNGDGHAAPGETFAVLLRDGDSLRAAELFTNDTCVDNTLRASDSWSDYDRAAPAARYSLPSIRPSCEPGHVVHMLARVVIPNSPNQQPADYQVRYAALEFPVWYRTAP